MTHLFRFLALSIFAVAATAATPTRYDPRETFAPFAIDPAPGLTRSANGLPGLGYWQNRADYSIAARLDPATHSIRGTVEIRYTNNSPDTLDVLWLNLEQNLYRADSRGNSRPVSARNGGPARRAASPTA